MVNRPRLDSATLSCVIYWLQITDQDGIFQTHVRSWAPMNHCAQFRFDRRDRIPGPDRTTNRGTLENDRRSANRQITGMAETKYQEFADLNFDDFRRMALDDSLSVHAKVGFPDSYREGKERAIFDDIKSKLTSLNERGKTVLDIGPGCGKLPLMLIDLCRRHDHSLILIDSEEMLAQLPDEPFVKKIAGYYPHCPSLADEFDGKVDAILTYSVLHYIFVESNLWNFLDQSLALLAHGGEMLIGDVPNVSKRKRFFSSPAGVKFHQEFTHTEEIPEVAFNQIEHRRIDDAVIFSLLMRARQQGFDAYVLPQRDDLPMANRREDILIRRP